MVLEVRNVAKHFSGVKALDGVSLKLRKGERHAIIGPNGAGKSTLLRIISSEFLPTEGTVLYDGSDITRHSPSKVARMGISRTFQQSGFFPEDSVLDNAMLASLGRRGRSRWNSWRRLERIPGLGEQAEAALAQVGLEHRKHHLARELSHGEHRQLEIAMALAQQPSVLLADEPLAGLAQAERQQIAELFTSLSTDLTVILVEHDVGFALAMAENTTVLHFGRVLAQGPSAEVRDKPEVEQVYTGGQSFEDAKHAIREASEEAVRVEGLVAGYGQSRVLHGVDVTVGKGEIVGLLGRNGMGKSTMLNCLMGLIAPLEGSICTDGEDVTHLSALRRAAHGIALVPQGRRIIPDLNVEEQLALGARPGPWTLERVYEHFPNLAGRKRVLATNLSGGEQQMLAIGRALTRNPTILLMDEPSEGLSPQMQQQVRDALVRLRRAGETILLAEQNVPLALSLADRIYVIEQGRLVFEGEPEELRAAPALLRKTLAV
jgi:branched-chain amino acid transport system ATP-binding protein